MLFKKKKETEVVYNENAKYKVLGVGCKKCTILYENLNMLKDEGAIEGEITKVSDPAEIAKYGVMKTPALVVSEELIFQGENPNIIRLKGLLE